MRPPSHLVELLLRLGGLPHGDASYGAPGMGMGLGMGMGPGEGPGIGMGMGMGMGPGM